MINDADLFRSQEEDPLSTLLAVQPTDLKFSLLPAPSS